MGIVKRAARVSRSDGDSSPGSKGSASEDEGEVRPGSSGVSDADSGMGSDEDSSPPGEPGTEPCQVGNQQCHVPLELYDLPDLSSVLSVEAWNDCLTEEERFDLAAYLPDLDQENFAWTLKELLSGANFHFGSPLAEFFDNLKGGQLDPKVTLYRQSLNLIQMRGHYRFLRSYQDSMVGNLVRIRDAWENCAGYGVQERLRVLNSAKSKKPLPRGGSDTELEDEDSSERVWSKRVRTRVSKPLLDEPAVFGRENAKGILKVAPPKASRKEHIGATGIFPVEQGSQMRARQPRPSMPLLPPPRQDRIDRVQLGSVQRPKSQMRVSGDDDDDYYLKEPGEEIGGNGDWDASHGNVATRVNLPKLGKKHGLSRGHERGAQLGYADEYHTELPHSLGSNRNTNQEVTVASYDHHPREIMKGTRYIEKDWRYPVKDQAQHQVEYDVEDHGGQKSKADGTLKTNKSRTGSDSKGKYNKSFLEQIGDSHFRYDPRAKAAEEKAFLEQIGESHFRYDPRAKAAEEKARSLLIQERRMKLKDLGDDTLQDQSEETESDSSEKAGDTGDADFLVRQLVHPSGALEGHPSGTIRMPYDPRRANKISKVGKKMDSGFDISMEIVKGGSVQTSRDIRVHGDESRKRGQVLMDSSVEVDRHEPSSLSLSGCSTKTKKRKGKLAHLYLDETDEDAYQQASPKMHIDDQGLAEQEETWDAEGLSGSLVVVKPDSTFSGKGNKDIEPVEARPKKPFTLITPTIHTGFSFSIIHLLSAVRKAMVTVHIEDSMEMHNRLKKDGVSKLKKEANDRICQKVSRSNHENMDMNSSDLAGNNLPSLTIHEIVNRVRSNPEDPCILETQEPLQDLVRGVLKIFVSKTAPLGAKGWKPLVLYDKPNKSWAWVGPLSSSLFDNDTVEEETSSEAWGIPHKMLVKLVDAFANWLKNGQEILKQIGSLPAPPMTMLQNLDDKERFKDLKTQKCPNTISPSSDEARAYFRKEEHLRYSIPDRAFSYTAADGKKSTVAPLRRGGGKPTSKARDHVMLKRDRPPHVTILCLVRDAAARLPGSIGTRADVCTLIKDSQYISDDISDTQVNQTVSGALDRLHYERDPCVQFDGDRKLWVYLHREREEEDFEDDGTSSTKKWKKPRKDNVGNSDMGPSSDMNYHGDGDTALVGSAGYEFNSDLNLDSTLIHMGEKSELCDESNANVESRRYFDDSTGNMSPGNSVARVVRRPSSFGEHEMLCQENSSNKDFGDEAFGRERSGRRLSALM